MSEKSIEMTEEPETATGINHENLSWTTCSDDQCRIHRSFKKTLNGIQRRRKYWGKKTMYFKQTLSNGNTGHGGNNNQNWEIRNPSIDHTKYRKYDVNIIRKPNQFFFWTTNISKSVKKQFSMSPSNQNMNFWDQPASGLKNFKKFRGPGSTMEKKN